MIKVIYWSGTGNTKNMADFIAEGIKEKNKDVEVMEVANANEEDIIKADMILLGCPAMGCEELEDGEMLPFIEDHAAEFNGKKVVLFGSYGWGSGEWMESWKTQMEELGACIIADPLIVNEFTKGQDEATCHDYGKQIVG